MSLFGFLGRLVLGFRISGLSMICRIVFVLFVLICLYLIMLVSFFWEVGLVVL